MFKLTIEAPSATSMLVARHQWPIRVTATNMDNTAAKIFVFQEAPPGGHASDFFSCVASALQMYALPEDEVGNDGPFYRVAVLELLCVTPEDATEFYEKIEDAVQQLVNSLAGVQTFAVQREIIIFPRLLANAPTEELAANFYTNSVGDIYVDSSNNPYVAA